MPGIRYRIVVWVSACYPFFMSTSDDYIIVTESHNLDESAEDPDDLSLKKEEVEATSRTVMQKQGIFLEKSKESPAPAKSFDEFSKELLEQSGIEIVPSEEGEFEA